MGAVADVAAAAAQVGKGGFMTGMRERFYMWLAWHLPRELVKWCAVRVGASATAGEYSGQVVPDLTVLDALRRWK